MQVAQEIKFYFLATRKGETKWLKKLTFYEDFFCDGNEIFSKSKRMHKITSNCFRDTECLQELKLAINFQLGL